MRYVGATELWSEANGATKVKCTEWVNHPDYISSHETNDGYTGPRGGNDYAVCKLESPVDIDTMEVYLELNEDVSFPIGNEVTQSMGMGLTGPIYWSDYSDYLLWGEFPVLDLERCRQRMLGDIDENMMCTFDSGSFLPQATCDGDSGGPVIIETEDPDGRKKHTAVGIVSWSSGYCGTNPDVHARVSSGMDWIRTAVCDGFGVDASFCDSGPPVVEPPDGDCVNNSDWRYRGVPHKDCDWVGMRPDRRCRLNNVANNCPLYCSEDCACVNKMGAPCDRVATAPERLCREGILRTICQGVCAPECS